MSLIKKTSILSDSRFPSFIRGNPEFDMLRRFIKSYFESIEEVWPDYPTKDDFFFNEDEY